MLGQIFVRKTGTIINGKEAVIIAGIVTLDDLEKLTIENESQYIIKGADIVVESRVDLKNEAKGQGIDGLFRLPIWKL